MSAVKAITQETFDSVVKENIDDFEMDPKEALEDAIDQFTKQGVNLNMIIKEVPTEDKHEVFSLINQLKSLLNTKPSSDEIKKVMLKLRLQFDKDLSYRYQAFKISHAENPIYESCVLFKDDVEMLTVCLQTLSALIHGQPDLMDEKKIKFLLRLIQESSETEHILLGLKLLRYSCVSCESNKKVLVENDGIELVLKCAEKFAESLATVRLACGVLRTLMVDDDVRVQFGKAHEYTKEIVTGHQGLERLFVFIKNHNYDISLASEICLTLGVMMVRNEFCQQIVDIGALNVIEILLKIHMDKPVLVQKCLLLIKSICGNDDVKKLVVKSEALDLTLASITQHLSSSSVCEAAYTVIAAASLRCPSNCDIIMKKNAAELITEGMKQHLYDAGVQKAACRAIRNLVARNRYHKDEFINKNIENIIRQAKSRHNQVLEDESKAALRDLNLDVDLKVRWLGKNGGLQN